MKEVEEKLSELQGQHNELKHSYETLQDRYASMKQELNTLRRTNESGSPESTYTCSGLNERDGYRMETLGLMFFDISAFSSGHDSK